MIRLAASNYSTPQPKISMLAHKHSFPVTKLLKDVRENVLTSECRVSSFVQRPNLRASPDNFHGAGPDCETSLSAHCRACETGEGRYMYNQNAAHLLFGVLPDSNPTDSLRRVYEALCLPNHSSDCLCTKPYTFWAGIQGCSADFLVGGPRSYSAPHIVRDASA